MGNDWNVNEKVLKEIMNSNDFLKILDYDCFKKARSKPKKYIPKEELNSLLFKNDINEIKKALEDQFINLSTTNLHVLFNFAINNNSMELFHLFKEKITANISDKDFASVLITAALNDNCQETFLELIECDFLTKHIKENDKQMWEFMLEKAKKVKIKNF